MVGAFAFVVYELSPVPAVMLGLGPEYAPRWWCALYALLPPRWPLLLSTADNISWLLLFGRSIDDDNDDDDDAFRKGYRGSCADPSPAKHCGSC